MEAHLGEAVLAGRYDRVCSVEAAQAIAAGAPNAELALFGKSSF
jgi:hypothetical protein